MRYSLRIIGVLIGTAMWSMAGAQNGFVVNHWICKMGNEVAVARSVPVGCEFVDLTLGCAVDSPLALTLNFQAPAGSVARLELTNVPTGLQPAVGVQIGTVKRVSTSTIEIFPGVGNVTGFVSTGASVPVASVTFQVPKQALTPPPNPWLPGPASAAQVKLDLTQVVGDYVADKNSIIHFYYPCSQKHKDDRLDLQDQASSGAVALIDARFEPPDPNADPCLRYADHAGVPDIHLPNLLSKQQCLERVAVFGDADAVWFRKESSDPLGDNLGPFWNVQTGQELPVPMKSLASQPLKIWVLHDPANMKQLAMDHLASASRIYRAQFGGIAFGFTDVEPDPGDDALAAKVAGGEIGCHDLDPLTNVRGFKNEQLNIFYVMRLDGVYGIWCGEQGGSGRDIILIGANALPLTLAHEIGHALLDSLGHTEELSGYSLAFQENLMTSFVGGEQLTLGQLFRTSLSSASSINRHGARPSRPQVTCSVASASPNSCPDPFLDVTPR